MESLILVGLIGWFDYATGWEWGFFAPYAVPIVLVTWKLDWRWGLASASLCAATAWAAQSDGNPYHSEWAFALAVFGWWFYFIILVVAVAAMKSHQALDRVQIEALVRMQELEREFLRAGELEQQRISRDLHDSLGPRLAALRYAAHFLADQLRQRGLPETTAAEQIGQLVTEAGEHARNLARGLFAVPFDGPGLAIALEELARSTSEQTGMSVSFIETGDTSVSDQQHCLHFYRIAREALSNAAKHSAAEKVVISLSRVQDSLRLTIADDGQGILPAQAGHPGMGLHSMRFRARAMGGELMIESSPGQGTIISCQSLCQSVPSPDFAA